MRHVMLGGEHNQPGKRAKAARDLLTCWSGGSYDPQADWLQAPGGFLWRNYVKEARSPSHAALRTTQVFLEFVRAVWLDQLSPQYSWEPVARERGKKKPEMCNDMRLAPAKSTCHRHFVPEYFFESPSEVLSWKAHYAAHNKADVGSR